MAYEVSAFPVNAWIQMSTVNIFFIDSRVQNKETLIRDIGTSAQCYVLDASMDGINQMQKELSSSHDLDSIQIIFHGVSSVDKFHDVNINGNSPAHST